MGAELRFNLSTRQEFLLNQRNEKKNHIAIQKKSFCFICFLREIYDSSRLHAGTEITNVSLDLLFFQPKSRDSAVPY